MTVGSPSNSGGASGGYSPLTGNSSSYYRTSISDLGHNPLLVQNTNTRVRSITNRRGAIKHQRYDFKFLITMESRL